MLPLLLLPGMMCDARLFWPQIVALSAERTVCVAPLVGAEDVAGLAARVLAAAPPRFALAGLSMGGIVAMEVLRQAPHRVARLALMDTNPFAETDRVAAARAPQIDAARAGRMEEVMRDQMKPRYLAPGPGRGAILDTVMDMARALGPEVFVAQSRALMTRPDQSDTLRRCAVPALVLCGRHDALCPPARHEAMAGMLPDVRLTVIEAAGHLPTLEAPEAVTGALRGWLAG